MDFENDLLIDRFGLDNEWAKQAHLFHKWSVQLAEAEMERDRAKENVDLVKAELDMLIRQNPSNFKIEKVTEAAVNSAIIVDDRYKKSVDEFLKLKYNHKVIQSAIESLNHKKYALDNLVRLFLSEYYLKENPPTDLHTELNKDDKLKKRLNRDRKL